MKSNILVWMIFIPLILFFGLVFYFEVSMYSILPPELGGMSFYTEFQNVWYRSLGFYGIVLIMLFYLILVFRSKFVKR